MKRRTTKGQGFSLYDLSDSISQAVEILNDALEGQGVTVQKDDLFLQLQAVVKSVGNGFGTSSYPMMASDEKAPYSVAGDYIAIAHQEYEAGNKKEAVTAFLQAAASEDFSEIANGLLEMNMRSEVQERMVASSEDTETDEDEDAETTDDGDESEEDDDDLSDDEIQTLIDEDDKPGKETDENTVEADDSADKTEAENKEESDETDEEEAEENEGKKGAPMGGTSSELNASLSTKILANKLSLDGSPKARARALDFMKKHPRISS